MCEEVLFTNKEGKEVYLPKATGEKAGLKVSKAYVPEELREPTGDDSGSDSQNNDNITIGQAIDVLREAMKLSDGMDKAPELESELESLGAELLQFVGKVTIVEGDNEQTGEPSLIDAIRVIEAQIDASAKITDNNKEVTKKQLAKLLEPAE